MKRLPYLMLLGLFIGFSALNGVESTVREINISSAVGTRAVLIDLLHKLFDEHGKNQFVHYLPEGISVEFCIQILREEQAALKSELDSMSYKNNVLFSTQGIKNMGLMVVGAAGILLSDWFMHHKLEHVSYSIAEELHKNWEHIALRWQTTDRPYDPQALSPLGVLRGSSPATWWRMSKVGRPLPAESLLDGLKRILYGKSYGQLPTTLPYSTYLTLYQLANKALTIGATVGGVGLIQDIKAFQNKKKYLSERYDTCTKMIELLEKNNLNK